MMFIRRQPPKMTRSNPRRRLRSDARVRIDLYKLPQPPPSTSRVPEIEWETADHEKPGVVWMEATFYDPEVDRDPRQLSREDVLYDDAAKLFYSKMGMGGVKAWWPSEAAWASGEPGKVEYIAAGSGFGPDILEAAADLFKHPLVLGAGWHPAIQLFKRYGGTVTPRGVSHFHPLQRDDPRALPAKYDVKNMASDAYNRRDLGWGVLPRYQMDAARFQEDPAKLAADEQR